MRFRAFPCVSSVSDRFEDIWKRRASKSGSLAKLTAVRRASSLVSRVRAPISRAGGSSYPDDAEPFGQHLDTYPVDAAAAELSELRLAEKPPPITNLYDCTARKRQCHQPP